MQVMIGNRSYVTSYCCGSPKPDFFPRGSRHTPGGDYVEIHKVQSTGSGLDASVLWRAGASPVMTTDDIFALTRRNDELSMGEHLRPYKDDVVVFGRIAEGPGVGFPHNTAHQPHPTGLGSPVDFTGPPIVETYPFMMCASTGVNKYKWFLGNGDPPDGDLNLDVYVPILDRIDSLGESSSFWASPEGWLRNRDQIRAKLEAQVRDHGFLRPNQKIHLELIMFGKRFDEDHCEADGESLLPGWADFNANSVLLNGRPINTHVQRDNTPSCQAIFFNSKSGCPVSNILGKALPTDSPKIHIRVAGALALDQHGGSFEEDDPQTNNVEIHPVYSLDIIDPDLINTTNATGTWAGSDAGTYYIRQVRDRSGQDIVWWLGVSRDRGRTLTTVFRGRLDADRIVGDWAAVPLGGSRQNGTLSLNLQRQGLSAATEAEGLTMVLRRDAESGGFPAVKMEKLYAPDFFAPDHTPPQSTLVVPTTSITGNVVNNCRPWTITATDGATGSGVQFVQYRFYPRNASPPTFTTAPSAEAVFSLHGPDGLYQVEYLAVDNVGNIEPSHARVATLVNSCKPLGPISQ